MTYIDWAFFAFLFYGSVLPQVSTLIISMIYKVSGLSLPMRLTIMRSTSHRGGFTLMEMLAVILLITTIIGFGVPALYSHEKQAAVQQAMNDLQTLHRRVARLQLIAAARGYVTDLTKSYRITIYGNQAPYANAGGITFTALSGQKFDANKRVVANVSPDNSDPNLWALLKEEFGTSDPDSYNNTTTQAVTSAPDGPGGYYKCLDADGFVMAISVDNIKPAQYNTSLGLYTDNTKKDSAGNSYFSGVKPGCASYHFSYENSTIHSSNMVGTTVTVPVRFTFRALPTGIAPPSGTMPTFKINRVLDIYCQGYTDVK